MLQNTANYAIKYSTMFVIFFRQGCILVSFFQKMDKNVHSVGLGCC